MTNQTETPNMDEVNAAVIEDNASTAQFTIQLTKPIMHDGVELSELSFDFDKLTGRDGLAVENEIDRMGLVLLVPTFNGEYLIRIAARACTVKMDVDALKRLSLSDYSTVRTKTRSFLSK